MENASKALAMAGGILIAIIIIALLVRSFTTIGIFQKAQLSEEEQAQLVAFNEQYLKYLGQYVYGVEVRTLINKYENDRKYKNDHKVEVVIEGTEPPTAVGQDTQYYKCEGVEYNSEGRINKIKFKEITISM